MTHEDNLPAVRMAFMKHPVVSRLQSSSNHSRCSPLLSSSPVLVSLSLVLLIVSNSLMVSVYCKPPPINDDSMTSMGRSMGSVETQDFPLTMNKRESSVIREMSSLPEPDCSDETVNNICERCAKATKSRNAYRSCCQAKEGVRSYCESILVFRPNFQTLEIDGNINRMALRRRVHDIRHGDRV